MASKYPEYMSKNETILKSQYSFVKLAHFNSKYRQIEDLWRSLHFDPEDS